MSPMPASVTTSLVHVGFAISTIDAEEAARAYRILEDIGQTAELTADRDEQEATG